MMASPVAIAELKSGPGMRNLIFNKESLERILQQAGNKKLAFISVVGPVGTGKSLLMSLIVRYLESLENGETEDWLFPSDNKPLCGFPFEASLDAVTSDIQIWPKAFSIKDEVAVFLVDTPGIYGRATNLRDWAGIVATTLLLSSSTIFNITKVLQEDSLAILETFIEIAKSISADCMLNDACNKAFQKIVFLIRDWNNPSEFDYGSGQQYLCKKFATDSVTPESVRVREALKSNVEELRCHLFPRPDDSVMEFGQPLQPHAFGELFSTNIREFMKTFLSPAAIQPKMIGGIPLTVPTCLQMLENNFKTFNANFKFSSNLTDVSIQMDMEMAVLREANFYRETVQRKLLKKSIPRPSHVSKYHADLKPYVLEKFQKANKVQVNGYLDSLASQVDTAYVQIQERVLKELQARLIKEVNLAAESIRDHMNRLTLSERGSPSAFQAAFDNVKISAKSDVTERFKSLEDEFKQDLEISLEQSLNALFAEIQKDNNSKLADVLAENGPFVEQAESIYADKIELLIDPDDGYMAEEKLEKFHKSAVAAATKLLLKKMTVPETAKEIRAMLLKQLEVSLDKELVRMKETNQQALVVVTKIIEDIDAEITKNVIQKLKDMSESSSVATIREVRQLHTNAMKEAREKFADFDFDVCFKSVIGDREKQLQSKLKAHADAYEVLLQNKLEEHAKQNLDESYDNFCQNVSVIAAELMEPEDLESTLLSQVEMELKKCEDMLNGLQLSDASQQLQGFKQKLDEKTQQLIENNNSTLLMFEPDLEELMNSTISDLSATLKNGVDASSSSAGSIAKHLESFDSRSSRLSLPRAKIEKRRSELLKKAHTLLEEATLTQGKAKDEKMPNHVSILSTMKSMKAEACQTFKKEILDFSKQFTILHVELYRENCERIESLVLSELKVDPEWSVESKQDLTISIKEELVSVVNRIWVEEISKQNDAGEALIKKEIALIKKSFEKELQKSENRDGLVDLKVLELAKKVKCSKVHDQERYDNELRNGLRQILEDANKKDQKGKEIELATEKLIKEYEDLARNHQYPLSCKQEILEKFKKIDENDAHQRVFSGKLEKVMQTILTERREKNQKVKKMNEFMNNLIKLFQSALKTKGSSTIESLKTEFAEKLETEAEKIKIEPAEFLSRLTESMGKFYEQYEKQMQKEVEEVVGKVMHEYRLEMSVHFSAPNYYPPAKMAELHAEATMKAFANLPKAKSREDIQARLKKELDQAYEEFNSKNCMNIPTSFAIGIDLGTTYCCVGVYTAGRVDIIPNDLGKKTTPSYVFFDENGDIVVGEAAKNQAHMYPERTIYEVKRLIGRAIDDPAIQGDLKKWPYKVVNERGSLKVEIGDKTYHPEEVSAEVLKKLRKIAEDYLGQDVTAAVITVPAYFTEGQKSATKKAGEAAGLHVLRILTEPTAAAIAYNLNWKEGQGSAKGLVYDLGGGTFDVAVFKASKGNIDIVNVGGDTHLGGVDFDNEMVNFCMSEFHAKEGIDLMDGQNSTDWKKKKVFNRRVMRLKRKCEQYKMDLSQAAFVNVAMDNIHESHDLLVKVEQSQFEAMISKHIEKSLEVVEEVLAESKMTKDDVDEIVLIGGSTRIPMVQNKLVKYFEKPVNKKINPDEAVAWGAAYEAAVLNGKRAQETGDIRSAAVAPKGLSIKDITPMSYGLEVQDGDMCILIPKQSRVPTEMDRIFTTHFHQQTSVLIVIYEGENGKAVHNTKVGEFFLNGIPPGLAGQQKIKVTMKVDWNGMITVSAVCEANGVSKNLTVRANRRGMK